MKDESNQSDQRVFSDRGLEGLFLRAFGTSVQRIPRERGLHPTQKPVALMEYMIRTYTNEEEELAEDIMKILTCYSARYYGARGGRKKKNKAENEPVESNGI